MKLRKHLRSAGSIIGLSVALIAVLVRPAEAGPGRYDPKEKVFHLTYTYALLPGFGSVGAPQQIDPTKDRVVRSFIEEVNQVLLVVTEGRGKVGSFEPVDSVQRADLVIAPVGTSDRVAWANTDALGKQGCLGIYYEKLAADARGNREGVVLTVAHELCHYLFGLPDEYPDASDGASSRHCPPGTGQGPGCIMDNYWTRPWYHKLCADDHNRSVASQRANKRYPESCKTMVNAFFAKHGVMQGSISSSDAGTSSSSDPEVEAEEAKLHVVIRSTIQRIRKAGSEIRNKGVPKLAQLARDLIEQELKSQGLSRTDSEIASAVKLVLKGAALVGLPLTPPGRFASLALELGKLAKRLASQTETGGDSEKGIEAKIAAVRNELLKKAIGLSPTSKAGAFKAEEVDYIDALARHAVLAPQETDGRPTDAAGIQFQMLHLVMEAVRALSVESNLAISDSMSDQIRALDKLAAEYKLPLRNRERFGSRRTVIIAPPAANPDRDPIPLTSGIQSYRRVRDIYLTQFAKLVQRNQLQFNKIDLRQRITGDLNERDQAFLHAAASAQETIFMPEQRGSSILADPQSENIQALLQSVVKDIRNDQLENIAVLVPPGGLPRELDDQLEELRRNELIRQSDVRLDVIIVGAQPISPVLRDLSDRSGGVILTISDTDEVAAIAQRLKNEQSAGSWIVFPRPFVLPTGTSRIDAMPDTFDDAEKWLTQQKCLHDCIRTEFESIHDILYRIDASTCKRDSCPSHKPQKPTEAGPQKPSQPGQQKPASATKDVEKRAVQTAADSLAKIYDKIGGSLLKLEPHVNEINRQLAILNTTRGSLAQEYNLAENQIDDLTAGIEKQTAIVVMKRILFAKDMLLDLESKYRPEVGKHLVALEALDHPSDKPQDQMKPVIEELGTAISDVYSMIYQLVRNYEMSVTTKLQPLNARTDFAQFRTQIKNLDPDPPSTRRNRELDKSAEPSRENLPSDLASQQAERIPFFAEEGADLEIVVGLSHLPPYKVPSEREKFLGKELVELEVLNWEGGQTTGLELDRVNSTPLMRVYRLPHSAGRASQWLQLGVKPNLDYARAMLGDVVRYTVSIASLRPNVQLNAGLVYEPNSMLNGQALAVNQSDIEGEGGGQSDRNWMIDRGTFSSRRPGPVVEVQVYGGAPILGATVLGLYQVLGETGRLNQFPSVKLLDNGIYPDRVRDDGVYTVQIPVDQTPQGGAEYRVAIQAFATNDEVTRSKIEREAKTRNIPLEPSDEATHKKQEERAKQGIPADQGEPQSVAPLEFQRATTVRFRVEN